MFASDNIYGQAICKSDMKYRIILPSFINPDPKDSILIIKDLNTIKLVAEEVCNEYIQIIENKMKIETNPDTLIQLEKEIKKIAYTIYKKGHVDKQNRLLFGTIIEPNNYYRIIGARKFVYIDKNIGPNL